MNDEPDVKLPLCDAFAEPAPPFAVAPVLLLLDSEEDSDELALIGINDEARLSELDTAD
jgi:hypothetical protein